MTLEASPQSAPRTADVQIHPGMKRLTRQAPDAERAAPGKGDGENVHAGNGRERGRDNHLGASTVTAASSRLGRRRRRDGSVGADSPANAGGCRNPPHHPLSLRVVVQPHAIRGDHPLDGRRLQGGGPPCGQGGTAGAPRSLGPRLPSSTVCQSDPPWATGARRAGAFAARWRAGHRACLNKLSVRRVFVGWCGRVRWSGGGGWVGSPGDAGLRHEPLG